MNRFRSSRPEVFCEKVFLEISQNSQGNTCARVSFLTTLQAQAYHQCQISLNGLILTLSCIILENDQIYFEKLAVFLRPHFLTRGNNMNMSIRCLVGDNADKSSVYVINVYV